MKLGPALPEMRLWSLSIDPLFDRPEQLRDYAAMFDAPPQWRFFTGDPEAVKAVRVAFDADDDNKMAHRSLILLRTSGEHWTRFEGAHNAATLASAAREAMALSG